MYLHAILLQIGFVGARIMIGFSALQFTSEPVMLGLLAAAFAAPAALIALPTGTALARWGPGPVIRTGIVVTVAACMVGALAPALALLILANAGLGIGQALAAIGQQAYVGQRSGTHGLDGAYGRLASAISIGQLIGALAIPAIGLIGAVSDVMPNTSIALGFAAGFTALALPLAVALGRGHTDGVRGESHSLLVGARAVVTTPSMWRALIVSGVVVAAVDLLYVFLPAWGVEKNVSALIVGWLLAIRALVTVVSRLGLQTLVDWLGRQMLLVSCLSLGVVGFTMLPFVGWLGGAVAMVALGIALGIPLPLTITWVVMRVQPPLLGAALGLRFASNRITQIVLPVAAGSIPGAGISGSFLAYGGLLAAALLISATGRSSLGDDV